MTDFRHYERDPDEIDYQYLSVACNGNEHDRCIDRECECRCHDLDPPAYA
jgi:hypothetical protein